MQNNLFVRPSEDSEGLRVPKFTKIEASLGYCVYEDDSYGLGCSDGPTMVQEFTIPVVLRIDAKGKEVQYTYRTSKQFADCQELVNDWLKNTYTASSDAGVAAQWVRDNAAELNYAKRYYSMKAREEYVRETEEKLRKAKIQLNIDILQVKQDRWIFGEERNLLITEFGGSVER